MVVLAALLVAWLAAGGTGAEEAPSDLFALAEEVYARRTGAEDARQAIALYQQALEAEPGRYQVPLRLAEAHWWLAEQVPKEERRALVEQGLVYARRAVELAPGEAETHYWHGVLQARVGEERGILQSLFMVDDVVNEMTRTLELDPNHEGAHYVLSQVYRKVPGWPLSVGDKRKALEHARVAAELSPDDTSRQLNLAESLLALGENDEAARVLQRVLDMPLTPGDEVNSRKDKDRAAELLGELGG
ncbi:tetratricopeptide repeat protein [Limnochorda pilosa]|uniref:tetratricopeptide repeat protein n=1 Tax=Limnochorda pilosa TaxID=1555112 RepID=UPI00082EF043|nr:tetratricopeptide repeat protein [Limnochorda pilosa]